MTTVEENAQVARLVQAMAGAITQNFRRVTLEVISAEKVVLRFLLERDIHSDREEIDDVCFEFQALQDRSRDVVVEVLCDDRPLDQIGIKGRVVFGRKEGK